MESWTEEKCQKCKSKSNWSHQLCKFRVKDHGRFRTGRQTWTISKTEGPPAKISVILNASFVKIVCFVALFKISTFSYHVQCAQHFSCTFLFIKISIRLGKDVHYLYSRLLVDRLDEFLPCSLRSSCLPGIDPLP